MTGITGVTGGAALSGLSSSLYARFCEWVDRRKPQEEEMLRAYSDNMRIPRDNDSAEIGVSKAQKSKIFVGSTRSKVRSARAKIKDSLFPAGMLPFDTKPANEELKQLADAVEEILSYQFNDSDWKRTLSDGVDSICVYGTGFIFGPFVKQKSKTSVAMQDMGGYSGLKERQYDYDCPYYEHGRSMDVYPDPEGEDEVSGDGLFWAARRTPDFIRSLKGEPGYSDAALDRAIQQRVTAYTDQGSDREEQARQNIYRYTKEGRIWFVRYFGRVKRSELEAWKKDNSEPLSVAAEHNDQDADAEERVEAVVIMAGGYVVKADENPYRDQRRPVRRCVYEAVPHEMWGVGIPKNNDPHQRVTNAAFRLYIEGKAFALLKTCSIDRSKFEVTEDFKLFPGKKYLMKPSLTPEERKSAIIWHDMVDVTAGWEKVIAMSETFSDDDTGVTKYTQGNDAQHLNKTATGISMIMNASSLPLKEVLGNIDDMWIEPMVEGLIEWNLDNLEPETVEHLLGKKTAEAWAMIKRYGKSNFMQWFATGSQTFMAKEVLMHKLQGFMEVTNNPNDGQYIDRRELLEQVWDAGQIGKESPIFDEETMKQNQAQAQNPAAMEEIQKIEAEAKKLIEQATEKARSAEDALAREKQASGQKEEDARRKAEIAHLEQLRKQQETQENSHLREAQIDKLQAETLVLLTGGGQQPSEETQEAGVETEGESNGAKKKRTPPLEGLTQAIQAFAEVAGRKPQRHRARITRGADGSLVGELEPIDEAAQAPTVQ